MAHPKRRQSKTRSRKRRTHYKAETPNVSTCSSTGQAHMFHRAHWYEGKLYYKGRVVMEKETAEACRSSLPEPIFQKDPPGHGRRGFFHIRWWPLVPPDRDGL